MSVNAPPSNAKADLAPVAPAREADLKFERRKMVGWFDPTQLITTGMKALLSGIFGAYADKREVQAALHPATGTDLFCDYREASDGLWFDFVADLGDGWDSTYTVARLLGEEKLEVREEAQKEEQRPYTLPRGRFLVLGGDQVYPTAKIEEYRDRFHCPYRFALPWVDETREPAPHLFAVPGNHDWYDGLTSFTRLFCQGRWIGGWKTRQVRSYFALRLPHNWWLWGIDIQLDSNIDRPQLDYFRNIAQQPNFQGARVILCTGSPSWVETVTKGPDAYQNLGHFENTIVSENGGKVELTLTGDLHHYCRYHNGDQTIHKIIAGGGGAYLYGTHTMPKKLVLDDIEDDTPAALYHRGPVMFPAEGTSRLLSVAGFFNFPFRNWKFGLLLGAAYALNAWLIQSASKQYGVTFLGKLSLQPFNWKGGQAVLTELFKVLAHSPVSVAFAVVLVAGLIGFAGAKKAAAKTFLGGIHGVFHIALNVILCWLFARGGFLLFRERLSVLNPGQNDSNLSELIVDYGWQTLIFTAEMLVVGSLLAAFLFSIYLVVCDLFGIHTNEAFSSQSIPHYKNFLRLHLDGAGRLRVFPIGIKKVCQKWKFMPGATNGKPFFEPVGGAIAERAHLIEGPIEFGPSPVIPPSKETSVAQT